MPSPITTHVLDTTAGEPAVGMRLSLFIQQAQEWQLLAEGITNQDGRVVDWLASRELAPGDYRLVFATGAWYQQRDQTSFYPQVQIEFSVTEDRQHYHVPLLISPYGYSTYRGS